MWRHADNCWNVRWNSTVQLAEYVEYLFSPLCTVKSFYWYRLQYLWRQSLAYEACLMSPSGSGLRRLYLLEGKRERASPSSYPLQYDFCFGLSHCRPSVRPVHPVFWALWRRLAIGHRGWLSRVSHQNYGFWQWVVAVKIPWGPLTASW